MEASILGGQLKTGDQLPAKRDLAQRFAVSRTTVREAIRALRQKGLVDAYTGRWTFVTHGASPAVRQSLDLVMRIGRQGGVTQWPNCARSWSRRLPHWRLSRIEERLVATMREAVATMDNRLRDPDAYVEVDLDFHLGLAEAAGNPLVLSLRDSIVGLLRKQRGRIFAVDGGPERGQFYRKRILGAIERRDPDAAREAMRAHHVQVHEDSAAGGQSQSKGAH